jgi:hypothetical protein
MTMVMKRTISAGEFKAQCLKLEPAPPEHRVQPLLPAGLPVPNSPTTKEPAAGRRGGARYPTPSAQSSCVPDPLGPEEIASTSPNVGLTRSRTATRRATPANWPRNSTLEGLAQRGQEP